MEGVKADCVFCDHDGLKDLTINRTKSYLSIVSNPRFRANHLLVIPTEHAEQMVELPRNVLGRMMAEAAILATRIDEGYGTVITQKFQPRLAENGVKVNHVHVHVWPRHQSEEDVPIPAPQSFDEFERNVSTEDILATQQHVRRLGEHFARY